MSASDNQFGSLSEIFIMKAAYLLRHRYRDTTISNEMYIFFSLIQELLMIRSQGDDMIRRGKNKYLRDIVMQKKGMMKQ